MDSDPKNFVTMGTKGTNLLLAELLRSTAYLGEVSPEMRQFMKTAIGLLQAIERHTRQRGRPPGSPNKQKGAK